MATAQTFRFPTLLRRELREYRASLIWTPVVTAIVLALLMLASVLLVNRVSVIGDTILDALMADGSVNVSISVGEETEESVTVIEVTGVDESVDFPAGADGTIARIETDGDTQRIVVSPSDVERAPDPLTPEAAQTPPSYEVVPEAEGDEERWNFSREWTFDPEASDDDEDLDDVKDAVEGRELNVMLAVIHSILLLILFITSANYLLSSLFDDRKDRSILFWRSMPVTEWENVSAKIVTALVVAPIIYIFISILLQFVYVILMILLVGRMGKDPSEVVVSNIDFVAMLLDPISGWVLTAFWIVPVYAWFLLASSAARRSPTGLAVLLPIGLFIAEGVFLGTEFIGDAIGSHLPHVDDRSAVGFYLFGPQWMGVDLVSIGLGLIFAAAALTGAVWLRRHRWEIN